MDFWVDLIASGNLVTLIIVLLIAIVTGGVGVSIVSGIFASRRGVKGDAIAKENTALSGLGTLTEGQQGFIEILNNALETQKAESAAALHQAKLEATQQVAALKHEFERELAYSNALIVLLAQNGISAPPRPIGV